MLKVPIFQNRSSDFTEQVTLDGFEISLRFAWNIKSKYWMLNTYEEIELGIKINGIKVVHNYPILYQFSTSLSGQFIILKEDVALESEITYDSFGNGYNLFYLSEDEFDLWKDDYGFQ